MKANELMIGDWVKMPSGLPEIRQIEYPSEIDDADFYEPIPLTAEILERNGFSVHVEQYSVSWLWLEDERFELAYADGEFTTAIGLLDISVKYVHQLQHLLKECGIEKEIEL